MISKSRFESILFLARTIECLQALASKALDKDKPRVLEIPLLRAERDWSWAMEVKFARLTFL